MFGQTSERRFSFESSAYTEALNRLLYVVESGEPFVSLMAADGTGKSTLLRRVRAECLSSGHSVALINVAATDESSFWEQLCCSLSVAQTVHSDRSELLRAIRDELQGRSHCRRRTVVILDDLHRAADDLIGAVQFLTAVAEQTAGSVTTIAATDGCLHPSLASLSALRVELAPLKNDDSRRFIKELLASGNVDQSRLSEDGCQQMVQFGCGYPARLERICEIVRVALATSPELQLNAAVIEALSGETLLNRAG